MSSGNQVPKSEIFSPEDRDLVTALTERLTGSSPSAQPKLESALVNIWRRMRVTESADLRDYLNVIKESPEELAHFISAVTIHTTSWFRELPHFDRLRHLAKAFACDPSHGLRRERWRLLSAGCSTGEEVYSMALVLEEVRQKYPKFDYSIEGWDVDPVSVAHATRAVYRLAAKGEIPAEFQKGLLIGSGKTEGLFALDKEIRSRCSFRRQSLLEIDPAAQRSQNQLYDLIFCRNVLIYFSAESVLRIVKNLVALLSAGGHICLGHSEGVSAETFGIKALGNTTYKRVAPGPAVLAPLPLSQNAAESAPVIPMTAQRPSSVSPRQRLVRPDIILVGASTGGTEALVKLLHDMPRPTQPVVVVQHIAESFARQFADRLASSSGLTLGPPVSGGSLQPHHLYMALGDYHIGVRRRGRDYILEVSHDPVIHSVRPSIDFLFKRAAQSANFGAIAAVILTGMGKDGAAGLAELKAQNAMTFVQDEASSAVFGMPKEAIILGAAGFIGDPSAIRQQLLTALGSG